MKRPSGVIVFSFALLALTLSCGDDDDATSSGPSTEAASDGTPATDGTTATTSSDDGPTIEPIPPLPDPAPALACDGSEVLCVDAAAGPSARDGSAEAPFASVADALAAAETGAHVQVAAGTYEEALVLADLHGVTLIGGFPAGGDFSERDPAANETTIQGNGEAPVIQVSASTGVRIEGLRLTGGGGWTDEYNWYGGGIYIDQTSTDVAIVGNRIDGNAVDHGADPGYSLGGGIASNGTAVTIIGNVVEGNRAGRGAGISAIGEATIEQNTVRDNLGVGDHGGGLYLAGDVTVTGNHVEGNEIGRDLGYGWAGGIIVFGDDTTATLRGNVVTDNMAPSAGSGVFVDDGADATLVGELYYANRCGVDGGGGLFVDSGGESVTMVDVANVTITQHDCPDSALGGNAILAEVSEADDAPPEVMVTNSIFWGNGGLDVFSAGATVDVTNSDSEEPIEGEGNISEDPLFVDPASGDFTVDPASPAIDMGYAAATS